MKVPHPRWPGSARLAPTWHHSGNSPVSVIGLPTGLSRFLLQGPIDNVTDLLAVFFYVTITFTHVSSYSDELLRTSLILYIAKQCISTALLNYPQSSWLLKKLLHERNHFLRNLLKDALLVIARHNKPRWEPPRLRISDGALLSSVPAHRNDWLVIPLPKRYGVLSWTLIIQHLNQRPALLRRMNFLWRNVLARHEVYPFVTVYMERYMNTHILFHIKYCKIVFIPNYVTNKACLRDCQGEERVRGAKGLKSRDPLIAYKRGFRGCQFPMLTCDLLVCCPLKTSETTLT